MTDNLYNRERKISQIKINNLDKILIMLLSENNNGNFTPPHRPVIERFADSLKETFNYSRKIVGVYPKHLDIPYPHFITDVLINNINSFSFDPNGTNNPDNTIMLNTINLHKANEIGQGECGLWCLAAMTEIIKEPNEESLIANSESKELIKRIAARFINFKKFMSGESKLESLGEKIDNNKVEQFLEEGKIFIRSEGFMK